MSIPVQDQALAETLATAVGVQQMVGPDGRVLGRFIPEPRPGMSFPEFGVTDEELARELADPNTPRFTAEEVMARLREIDRCTR
jgi:hypothetical protein